MNMQNLRRQARETMDNVTIASERVVSTTELAAVALIGVAAVSMLALVVAVIALGRIEDGR